MISLPTQTATDRQPIQRGHIYVAPSDYHLLVDRSYTYITRGPRENRARPAIDPLFRSAAVVHGPHVVGVILSGTLDDGTSGLAAVKRCGGVAVVQDPSDAAYPEMPQNALDAIQVVHCVALREMGGLLVELTAEEPGTASPPPMELLGEVEIARSAAGGVERLNELGELAPFTCADRLRALLLTVNTMPRLSPS